MRQLGTEAAAIAKKKQEEKVMPKVQTGLERKEKGKENEAPIKSPASGVDSDKQKGEGAEEAQVEEDTEEEDEDSDEDSDIEERKIEPSEKETTEKHGDHSELKTEAQIK